MVIKGAINNFHGILLGAEALVSQSKRVLFLLNMVQNPVEEKNMIEVIIAASAFLTTIGLPPADTIFKTRFKTEFIFS